jgi:hypothetical protein
MDSPHGVTPALVAEIASNDPVIVPNRPGAGRSGSHRLIGPADDRRFWTVILLQKGDDTWRPITGWPSTKTEIQLHMEAE